MFAQPFIDSLEFARQGKELRGELPVSALSRLQDVLATQEGNIVFHLRGFQSKDEKLMLELLLEGSCQPRCQRCLEAMTFPVLLMSRLHLAEGEMDEFADEDEEFDSIAASPQLDVAGLIEDELLLALPFAPRHAEGECEANSAGLSRPETNPFAVLAGLKSK
jgi:uncharacterized protein